MIEDSRNLKKGQLLKVDISKVKDRLPKKILRLLKAKPIGRLVGYKMVDGNQFGLALEIEEECVVWFFEEELIEIVELN